MALMPGAPGLLDMLTCNSLSGPYPSCPAQHEIALSAYRAGSVLDIAMKHSPFMIIITE